MPLFCLATMLFYFGHRSHVFRPRTRGIRGILSSSTAADLRRDEQWRCLTGDGADLASETDRATQCRGGEHEDKFKTVRKVSSRDGRSWVTRKVGKAGGFESKNLLTPSTYTISGRHLTTVLGYPGAAKHPDT